MIGSRANLLWHLKCVRSSKRLVCSRIQLNTNKDGAFSNFEAALFNKRVNRATTSSMQCQNDHGIGIYRNLLYTNINTFQCKGCIF